jgi:hypothetical protein
MSRSVCAGEFKTGARGINQTSLRRVGRTPAYRSVLSRRAKRAATLTFLHALGCFALERNFLFVTSHTRRNM